MSADAQVDSWKTSFPCTRAEAEAIDAGEIALDAVLMTTEEVEDDVERWRLDAYSEAEPDAVMIAALRALVPSAGATAPAIEPLTAQDWVAMSQEGLEPIAEGRFVVHTSAHPVTPPPGGRAFLIDAGRAFGTGHHATTSGCLKMLDGMAGGRFASIIDIGTGTGLLAFAARHLWPDARVTASDIDAVAIAVAQENAIANGIKRVEFIVADGAYDRSVAAGAPYDLIIANILAGPLIALAPEIAGIAGRDAALVLAGMLTNQAGGVEAAYRAAGCTMAERLVRGDWTILRLAGRSARDE